MSKITIQKGSLSNLETIQKISIQTFTETFAAVNTIENIENYILESFHLEQLKKELNNPDSQFYIAYSNLDPIGYLKINCEAAQTENQTKNALEIHRIYVLQSFHGKNVGQILLEKAITIAKKMEVNLIWLGVWEENYRAQRFYSKNGFQIFDKHQFVLGDEVQTDFMMQLLL